MTAIVASSVFVTQLLALCQFLPSIFLNISWYGCKLYGALYCPGWSQQPCSECKVKHFEQ